MIYEIALPFPPSVNMYWRHRVGPRGNPITHISHKGRKYREDVEWRVLRKGIRPAFNVPIRAEIAVLMPDRRRRDLDNLLKSLLDALEEAGVYTDDKLIRDLRIFEAGVQKPGGVRVRVRPIP